MWAVGGRKEIRTSAPWMCNVMVDQGKVRHKLHVIPHSLSFAFLSAAVSCFHLSASNRPSQSRTRRKPSSHHERSIVTRNLWRWWNPTKQCFHKERRRQSERPTSPAPIWEDIEGVLLQMVTFTKRDGTERTKTERWKGEKTRAAVREQHWPFCPPPTHHNHLSHGVSGSFDAQEPLRESWKAAF